MNFSEIDQLPAALRTAVICQTLSKGEVLFHRNDASQAIYAVKAGQIRLLHYTQSGQSISHYTVRTGEICAEVSLFLDTYSCTAIAEEPTQVLAFPKQVFLELIQQNSEFAIAFVMQVSQRLHSTKMMVELRSIRSAQERVLHYLRLIVPPEQNTVVLNQPLKDIAADLSISPEALSRTLAQLANDGTIARQKRRITLLGASA
ncbi:MAG: Crp/Fnr family transcriptional regulator [Pegethrix bostrychoides GSE-TBD4-15B]|jgi:CRP-like cAMP-binding protein|uniref:Crp/Fnr family transcriptional regulator n=1 Tax=Pegethrix bostrychoides GSE-TBD4-15B TaxID=2839662 RepID=A0A951U767_9CYAN|nr:Crp/Fnr family transcriptional regulator [Pegethrix bostrychoides GSE-TBD4-15B]